MTRRPAARPNFFIVGAPRCGTTWLYETIRRHPDVYMPERKEPGFFCGDLDTGSAADSVYFVKHEEEYLRLFAGGADRRVRGEATTWYLYSSDAPRRIHAFDANARIVAILRNPIDMMFSLYRWRLAGGAEDIPTFERALAAEPERSQGRQLPPRARLVAAYRYLDAAHFGRQVKRYLDLFGEDGVLILFLEDLRSSGPVAVTGRLCEFVGIAPAAMPEPPAEAVNAAIAARGVTAARLYYSPSLVHAVRRYIPRGLYRPVRRISDRLTDRPATRADVDADLRARLEMALDDDVRLLEDLLHRDLSGIWW